MQRYKKDSSIYPFQITFFTGLTSFNFDLGIYSFLLLIFAPKFEIMEELKKQRGGKREGAGRKAVGLSTHPMALKLDNDLFEILNQSSVNKNRYINDAVRAKMKKDGLI